MIRFNVPLMILGMALAPSFAALAQGQGVAVRVAQGNASGRMQRFATGMLEVVTQQPGAQVWVDGGVRGRTPVRVAGLLEGVHVVEVGTAGKASYRANVKVVQNSVVHVDASQAGSPSDALGGSLVAGPSPGDAVRGWLQDNPVVVTMLRQPWAYAAGAATGVALIGAGLLWTASPQRFPVLGKLPLDVSDSQYKMAQWASLGAVAGLALGTVVLFLLPGLPVIKDVLAPAPSNTP